MDQSDNSTAPPGLSPAARLRCVLIAVAPLPLVTLLGIDLAQRPHYAFVLLALPAAALLGYRRLRAVQPSEPGDPARTRYLLAAAWVVLAGAVYFWSRWGGAAALVLGAAAVVWHAGGRRLLGAAAPALALVLLCAPWPFDLDRGLVAGFVKLTASWASHLLDLFRVPHVREGTWFEVVAGRADVADLFTGLHSPLALVAAALIVAVLLGRGVLRTTALVVDALVFAVPAAATVSALAVQWMDAGIIAWHGWLFAALAFWTALALALSLDQLFGIPAGLRLQVHVAAAAAPAVESPRPARWLPGWPAAAAFGALLALQVGHLIGGTTPTRVAGVAVPAGVSAPDVPGWAKLAGPEPDPGVVLSARYRKGRQTADFAVYTGADDPVRLFERQGWAVRRREPMGEGGTDWTSVRVRLERPLESAGTLWVGHGPAKDGAADRWLWVFVESYLPLDVRAGEGPEQLFLAARKQLGPRLTAEEGAP